VTHPSDDPDNKRPARYGPFAVATVTMALVVWPIAFNLGAYDAVFYDDIFRFVVAALAGLLVTFFAPPYSGRTLWFMRCALAAPVAWLLMAVLLFDSTAGAATDPVFGWFALLAALLAIPAVFLLLIELFVPEITTLDSTRLVVPTVVVVAIMAICGYVVGANNDAFLTCDDFKTAGSDEPANCAKE
jgi:hypothetical protein